MFLICINGNISIFLYFMPHYLYDTVGIVSHYITLINGRMYNVILTVTSEDKFVMYTFLIYLIIIILLIIYKYSGG